MASNCMMRLTICLLLICSFSALWGRWDGYATAGYRRDNFNWSFGVPGVSAVSELQYTHLDGIDVRARIENFCSNGIWFGLDANLAWLWHGRNQNSDFLGNNRTDAINRSHSDVRGTVGGIEAAVGYFFCCGQHDPFLFIPVVGYGCHVIYLAGAGKESNLPPPAISFRGILGSDTAAWLTGFVGFEVQGSLARAFYLRGQCHFHAGQYLDVGTHPLRSIDPGDLTSYRHYAAGFGVTGALEGRYRLSCRWSAVLGFGFQRWWTAPGAMVEYSVDGTRIYGLRMNAANWIVYDAHVGLLYCF